MSLHDELMTDIFVKLNELNKGSHFYTKEIESIFINFDVFNKLSSEEEAIGKLIVSEKGLSFCGIPIVRGDTVEKWELRVNS